MNGERAENQGRGMTVTTQEPWEGERSNRMDGGDDDDE